MKIDFIDELKRYLIEKYESYLIILYGSYIRGDYTQESDIDVICFTEKDFPENDTSTLCGVQLDAWIYKSDSMKNIEQYLRVKDGKILYDKFSLGNNFLDAINQTQIQLASATPPHLAKTSAGVLKPKHFIGVALILLTTLSIFFCVVKRQSCFLGKYLRSIPLRFSMLPFSQLW